MSDQDIEYIDGLIIKPPHERAPDFVKCKLSFKREQLIAWLQSKDSEWINADVKVSKGGKWYAAVDQWKPDRDRQQDPEPQRQSAPPPRQQPPAGDDDIPF